MVPPVNPGTGGGLSQLFWKEREMGAVPPHCRPNTPKPVKVGVTAQSVHPGEGPMDLSMMTRAAASGSTTGIPKE